MTELSTLLPGDSHQGSSWFHALQLPDGQATPGRFDPHRPPNYTLYGVFELLNAMNLAGCSALDIGTMDGLVAFGLKLKGVAQVTATDLAERETFQAFRQFLGLELDYQVGVTVQNLPQRLAGLRVDLVVMAGVLYHVLDPLGALLACRTRLKPDGLLVLETQYLPHARGAVMHFNPADTSPRANQHVNVFWRGSLAALQGMLQLTGFEPLASVRIRSRIALVARAARPGEVRPVTERMARIFAHYGADPAYHEDLAFAAWTADASPPSRLRYGGPLGERRLWAMDPAPAWPLQPPWNPPPAVQRRGRWREQWADWRGRWLG